MRLAVMTSSLDISRRAATLIREKFLGEMHHDSFVRLTATRESCGCLNFDLKIARKSRKDDITIRRHGLAFVMDQKTLSYVKGLQIESLEDSEGKGITFLNPNESHHE